MTAVEPMVNIFPKVLFRSSTNLAQLLSVYYQPELRNLCGINPKSNVPKMYLKMRLAAPRCCFVGEFMNLEIMPTEKDMSGQVCVKYISIPTNFLYIFDSALLDQSHY